MKRCPQCNRAEADDALTFCRVDGTPLVRESGFVSEGAGTLKFGSAPLADQKETRIPKQAGVVSTTGETLNRPTAPTTVLDGREASDHTVELSRPKSRRRAIIAVAAILVAGLAVSTYLYQSRGKSAAINSIAVLPFQNASGDPNMDYLSDGVTESIINSLSRLPQLKVMARSTVFRFKGRDSDSQAVGEELGVGAVMTGRMLQQGDTLTVSVELVNVVDGTQLWGEQYNRRQADLVTLQGEIARDVSNKLRVKLSGADEQRVTKAYTANTEAYQLYLQGLYHWHKRTPEDIRKSIALFQRAAEKDPSYAQAYAGLALAYGVLPSNSTMTQQEKKEIRLRERAALSKAQELDDSLAEVHAESAALKHGVDWDFAGAEIEFKRAIELNPNYATAHQWYSEFLSNMGRHEEAFAQIKKAHEIDPFSRAINNSIGVRYFDARRFDEAIAQYKKVIEMEPNYPNVHAYLAQAYEAKDMYSEAIAEIRTADILLEKDSAESSERKAAAFTQALKTGGAQGYWQKRLEVSLKEYEEGYKSAYYVAEIYARLGNKDRAFEWLEKSFATHEQDLVYIKVKPAFDGLSSDPRFTDLIRRVGFPQ